MPSSYPPVYEENPIQMVHFMLDDDADRSSIFSLLSVDAIHHLDMETFERYVGYT